MWELRGLVILYELIERHTAPKSRAPDVRDLPVPREDPTPTVGIAAGA